VGKVCRPTARFQAPHHSTTTFPSSIRSFVLQNHSSCCYPTTMAAADESGFTGRRQLKGEKAFQGDLPLPHPHFRAGENSRFNSERSPSTAQTAAGPQHAFDWRNPGLGNYHPVNTYPSQEATLCTADNGTSGRDLARKQQRNCGGRLTLPKKPQENVNEQPDVQRCLPRLTRLCSPRWRSMTSIPKPRSHTRIRDA